VFARQRIQQDPLLAAIQIAQQHHQVCILTSICIFSVSIIDLSALKPARKKNFESSFTVYSV
jgi:hypothetical protein